MQNEKKDAINHQALFENMVHGVVYQDECGNIVAANPAAEAILGLKLDQMQGRTSFDPRWKAIQADGSDFPGEDHPAMIALATNQEIRGVVMGVFIPSEEKLRWIEIDAVPQCKDGENKPYQVFTTFSDITDRRKAEEKIHQLAMTDQLTGLANRTQLNNCMMQSIKLANREKEKLALLMLDLDEFKNVNDSFGHPVGDALLNAVASILTRLSRETDVVARIGGDEFMILVVHPDSEENAGINAQRIIDEIKKPITINENIIQTSASIGIATYPGDAKNHEELHKYADRALYEAKRMGRGIFTFYSPYQLAEEE